MKIAIITDQHFGCRKNSKLFHDYFLRFYEDVFFPTIEKEGITTIVDMGDTFDSRKGIDFGALNWAKENSKDQNFESIVKDEEFKKTINEVINKVNKNLSVIEHVRKFILIDHEFTIENSMMTPSMKVRRFAVKDKYGDDLEKLY